MTLTNANEYGPKVTVIRDCGQCPACVSETYRAQGDSGSDVYCVHPNLESEKDARKLIGDTTWKTPAWCPALIEAETRGEA